MSLATLSLHDAARGGFSVAPCAPVQNEEGRFAHPLMWHDAYQRVSEGALSLEAERCVIELAQQVGVAVTKRPLSLHHTECVLLNYLGAIQSARAAVAAAASEPFTPAVLRALEDERSAQLFNVAMIRFLRASRLRLDIGGDARTLFHEAAGIFDSLLSNAQGSTAPTFERSPAGLRVLSAISLACAAEVNVMYWQKDTPVIGERIVAELAHRTCHLYRVACVCCRASAAAEGALQNFCEIKRHYYEGLTYFLLSLEGGCNKGDSRRRKAHSFFDAALECTLQMLPNQRKNVEEELEVMTSQCVNYTKLSKSNKIPHAAVTSQRKRNPYRDHLHGPSPSPALPGDLRLFFDLAVEAAPSADPAEIPVEPSEAATSGVNLEVATEHRNLCLKNRHVPRGDAQGSYRFVQSVITVASGEKRAPTAIVFIVDVNSLDRPTAASLKELLVLALSSSLLEPGDAVGLVLFGESATVRWWDWADKPLSSFEEALKETSNASRGAPIVAAAAVASAALRELPSLFRKEIVLVTDLCNVTTRSLDEDVKMFLEQRGESGAFAQCSSIPIHCFVIGSVGAGALLQHIADATDGDFAHWVNASQVSVDTMSRLSSVSRVSRRNRAMASLGKKKAMPSDGAALFRQWVVNILTASKQTPLRDGILSVTAMGEVKLHSLDWTASSLPLPRTAPLHQDARELRVQHVAHDAPSTAVATFAVPAEVGVGDTVDLGTATLCYTDVSGRSQSLSEPVRNVSASTMLDREFFVWLGQLDIEKLEGRVSIQYATAPPLEAAVGGETLVPSDTLITGSDSRATLRTVEDSLIDVEQKSELLIQTLSAAHSEMSLVQGGVTVMTGSFAASTVSLGGFTFKCRPDTVCRFEIVSGTVTVQCIMGALTTVSRSGASNVVTGPCQMVARLPGDISSPWILTRDVLEAWLPLSVETKRRVELAVALDEHRARHVVSRVVALLARLVERKNCSGTLPQSTLARRGRKILMLVYLEQAKKHIANSLFGGLGGRDLQLLKRQLDVAHEFGIPTAEEKQSWKAAVLLRDVAKSLVRRRPVGLSQIYVTPSQFVQGTSLLGAKEQATLKKQQQRAEEQELARSAEEHRRCDALSEVAEMWDLSAAGGATVSDITTVLCSLGSRHRPEVARALRRWDPFVGMRKMHALFSPDHVASLLHFVTDFMEPDEFNSFVEDVAQTLEHTLHVTDATRLHRASFMLFMALDQARESPCGWLTLANIETAIIRSLGDNQRVSQRLQTFRLTSSELITARLQEDLQALHEEQEEEEEEAAAALEDDEIQACREDFEKKRAARAAALEALVVTPSSLETERITASTFSAALVAMLRGQDELAAHTEISIMWHLATNAIPPEPEIRFITARDSDAEALRELVDQTLPHSFDGVTPRDLRDLAARKEPPQAVRDVCAPICLQAGLGVRRMAGGVADHWSALRAALRRDAPAFLRFLKRFPVLSVTPRHAAHVKEVCSSYHLNHSTLMKQSPALIALYQWVQLGLRGCHLTRNRKIPPASSDTLVNEMLHRRLSSEKAQLGVKLLPSPPPDGPPPKARGTKPSVRYVPQTL